MCAFKCLFLLVYVYFYKCKGKICPEMSHACIYYFCFYQMITRQGIECSYIYSALDQTARKINIGKFVHRKCMVMIVTDVAARGIDIPMLDNVINYNFPSKAKLFLHRVGKKIKIFLAEGIDVKYLGGSSIWV